MYSVIFYYFAIRKDERYGRIEGESINGINFPFFPSFFFFLQIVFLYTYVGTRISRLRVYNIFCEKKLKNIGTIYFVLSHPLSVHIPYFRFVGRKRAVEKDYYAVTR